MSDTTRRHLLASGGVAALAALAGCQSSGETDDGDGSSPTGTVLGDVSVQNAHGQEHTIDVQVEFHGGLTHWSTHVLDEDTSSSDLERDWQEEPGPFRVRARLDSGSFAEVTPATWNDPACLNLLVLVDRSGELSILATPEGGPCAAADAAGVSSDD
ncbi:hypothetical protein [Natronobiforma cellulositropha]|uniref:hypothetical protein n=1 Tax=Natronobiforma cellulositropha TaxID=1679076 RepID=UPI0021D59967|nr:hypothetical protein [Natronobiforma cellulositropha]